MVHPVKVPARILIEGFTRFEQGDETGIDASNFSTAYIRSLHGFYPVLHQYNKTNLRQ
jgi:hypothetical protein